MEITEESSLAIGRTTKTQVAQVYITHKEESELEERVIKANIIRNNKKIPCEIAPVDFDILMEERIDAYDPFFVCAPMAALHCLNNWKSWNFGRVISAKIGTLST